MEKLIYALVVVGGLMMMSASEASAQYTPDWAALDQRPTPEWWTDARFGIFLHWGLYSVPAFSRVGDYAEWYWQWLESDREGYRDFHERVYGTSFAYADFAPLFRAELFDPDEWASIFRRSGARYVVLTSKHHDGFALWPSAEASRTWGRPWNSVDTGPRRDLVGDLTEAVRKAGLEMGLYFSLYEWFNPLYRGDVARYVDEHYIPQFKDVVTRYRPSIIFADGEWDHSAETWKSAEVVAWLLNESPVRDEVVINDRWGSETRHRHGGYYTTEYGSGLADAAHPWEETRGMGHSFGYSRTESADDYTTAQELILMLVDIVSRGGNLLLNVGPTADGRIPVIMQDRLLQMGAWLDVNGEAIYGTMPWRVDAQWTEGEIREPERTEYMGEYDILKLTLHPDLGMAAKEILFTQKDGTLYAITPRFPRGELIVRNVSIGPESTVALLGHERPLQWRSAGSDLIIEMPDVRPDDFAAPYAYTFRLEGAAE